MGGGAGEVGDFVGVFLVVVELHAVLAFVPFGVAEMLGANGAAELLAFQPRQALADAGGAVGGLAQFFLGVDEQRREADTLEMFRARMSD